MQAEALICDSHQQFSLGSVTLPDLDPASVVIRTLYSGVSVGTEFALVRGKLDWGPFPICTGYMAVGVVEAAGDAAGGFRPGDKVYYRDNGHMTVAGGRRVAPVAGTHCSMAVLNVSRTHGLARLPAGADEAAASMFVLPAVGLNGVDQAAPRMGQIALVHGCGPVGLGVVAALAQRGCRIVAADLENARRSMASMLGADTVLDAGADGFTEEVRKPAPDGYDVVFECTGIPACIKPSLMLCRPRGGFVWQGNYGQAPFPFEFLPPHMRQLTMHFPCNDGLAPCRAAVVKQMALGLLPWERVISHRVPASEAPAFFDDVNRGAVKGLVGAVIDWRGRRGNEA